MDYIQYKDYLMHHGVKGQKWGVINEKDNASGTKPKKHIVKGTLAGVASGAATSALIGAAIGLTSMAVLAKTKNTKLIDSAVAEITGAGVCSKALGAIGGITVGALVGNKVANKNKKADGK